MPDNIVNYLAFVELFVYHRFFSVTVISGRRSIFSVR